MYSNKNILTGQQLNILGGPLYITYKVLGAFLIGKKEELNPIYWLDGNDSDFEEINHFTFIDKNGQIQYLKWNKNTLGYSCGYILVDSNLIDIIKHFFSSIQQTKHTHHLKKKVLNIFKKNKTLLECSINLAKFIFEDYPIVFFDPSNEKFRKFSQSILQKEAYKTKNHSQANCFALVNKKRKAIFKKNNQFITRDQQIINIESTTLLPNLKTRNICQDAFFNTKYYVGGPGEEKYLKTLDFQYNFHKVKKPPLKKRANFFIIEPIIKKIIQKNNFKLKSILSLTEYEFKKKFLLNQTKIDFIHLEEKVLNLKNEFVIQIKKHHLPVKKLERYMYKNLKDAMGLYRFESKKKYKNELHDIKTIYSYLYPFNIPQQRNINIFYYFNLYGKKEFLNFLIKNYQFTNNFNDTLFLEVTDE